MIAYADLVFVCMVACWVCYVGCFVRVEFVVLAVGGRVVGVAVLVVWRLRFWWVWLLFVGGLLVWVFVLFDWLDY